MTTLEAVERAISLALAPAFLLTATMTALNALTSRLTRILDRMGDAARPNEQGWLQRRSRLARRAVQLCAVSAVLVALQVVLTFAAALLEGQSGTLIAIVLSLAMLAFMAAMLAFLVETIMAERGPR
ncbi:MAG: DUF2721 domain-containing protein [Alphaproteobacteria bacterium]|nr:DUF2721 domain-containing protein [Alphaproteobacteria bacterium]